MPTTKSSCRRQLQAVASPFGSRARSAHLARRPVIMMYLCLLVSAAASLSPAAGTSPFCAADAPDSWPRFHASDADNGTWHRGAHDANGIFSHGEYRHVMNQRAGGWGHVVSTDWVTWERLPLALAPGHGGLDFDGGVSVVNGVPVIMWDCTNDPVCNSTDSLVRGDAPIVGVARPADAAGDPKLAVWVKDPHNPIVVDKGAGHYNAPSNIWSPSPGRWDILFCLGWDPTWKGPITTALYTTTDPELHSWTQRNASFFTPHYGGGGSFWPIPGVLPTATLSHMLSADFGGHDGRGTFALGHYDAAAETFTQATEKGGVVDFSSGVRYFELGYSPPAAASLSQSERLVMVGWTSAYTSMTIVREISFDAELQQLLAVPVVELAGLRGARIDDGKSAKTLAPKQKLVVAHGAAARSADLELNFTLPTGEWQATVSALDGSAALTLSGNASAPRAMQVRLAGTKTPYEIALKPGEASIAVRVLADKVIAEFFVQGGRAVGTFGLSAGVAAANATMAVVADVGALSLTSVAAWTMKCGWKSNDGARTAEV